MKINMQIALSQSDIVAAIQHYIRSELSIPADQEIVVTLQTASNGEIWGSAITDEPDNQIESQSKQDAPKRTRRTKAQIEADRATEAAGESASESQAEEQSQEDDASFDTAAQTAEAEQEEQEEQEEPAVIKPVIGSSGIFANAGSSAPILEKPATTPPLNGKSLFGNLTGPTASH